MENTEKIAIMKAKYLELGKKLWLKDELLNTIEKELTEKEEAPKMEEEAPKVEILNKTCENQDSPLMVMIKKKGY